MSVEVTIQDAYMEACRALGEEIVQGRLMSKAFAAREAELMSQRHDEEPAAAPTTNPAGGASQ